MGAGRQGAAGRLLGHGAGEVDQPQAEGLVDGAEDLSSSSWRSQAA